MARPKTKTDLLAAAASEHAAVDELLASLNAEQMVRPGIVGEWSVKDVLAHLAEWEQMCLAWWAASQRGERPPTPAAGFNWGQLPELNERIYIRHRDRPLDEVLAWYEASFRATIDVIESLSEEQLWLPGGATFTTGPVGTYFVSCTSSHYHWARTEIRKGLKRQAASSAAAAGE